MTRCTPEFPNAVEGRFRVCVYHTDINYAQTHRWLTVFVHTCRSWQAYNNDNELKYSLSFQLTGLNSSRKMINYTGDFQTVRRGAGYFNLFVSFSLCVLFFQTATKLLGQIVIKFLGLNYLINGSVKYFLWHRGAVKSCWDNKGAVNRESLGRAAPYFQQRCSY
jgi:hypothetical protein